MTDLFELHREWAEGIGLCRYRKIPSAARQNLLQDQLINAALIGLQRAVERFNPEKGLFKGFASKHVLGAIKDELRQHTRQKMGVSRLDVQAAEESPEQGVLDDSFNGIQDKEEVKKLLDRIPPRSRKLLVMHVLESKSFADISRITGLSAWKVSRRIRLALKTSTNQDAKPDLEEKIFSEMITFYMKYNRGPTNRELQKRLSLTRVQVDNAVIRLRAKGRIKPVPKPPEIQVGIPVLRKRRNAS